MRGKSRRHKHYHQRAISRSSSGPSVSSTRPSIVVVVVGPVEEHRPSSCSGQVVIVVDPASVVGPAVVVVGPTLVVVGPVVVVVGPTVVVGPLVAVDQVVGLVVGPVVVVVGPAAVVGAVASVVTLQALLSSSILLGRKNPKQWLGF